MEVVGSNPTGSTNKNLLNMNMKKQPEEWYELAEKLHDLILNDIENTSSESLPEVYPKLVIMYEFFRLIRGEAFHSSRPSGISTFQKEIYKMEDNLAKRLKNLEKRLDTDDSRTSHCLNLMKKSFNLNYFN